MVKDYFRGFKHGGFKDEARRIISYIIDNELFRARPVFNGYD